MYITTQTQTEGQRQERIAMERGLLVTNADINGTCVLMDVLLLQYILCTEFVGFFLISCLADVQNSLAIDPL